jgi:hypothetical protein
MMTAIILVGWIWSVCQGVAIYNKSNAYWDAQAATTVNLKSE